MMLELFDFFFSFFSSARSASVTTYDEKNADIKMKEKADNEKSIKYKNRQKEIIAERQKQAMKIRQQKIVCKNSQRVKQTLK